MPEEGRALLRSPQAARLRDRIRARIRAQKRGRLRRSKRMGEISFTGNFDWVGICPVDITPEKGEILRQRKNFLQCIGTAQGVCSLILSVLALPSPRNVV